MKASLSGQNRRNSYCFMAKQKPMPTLNIENDVAQTNQITYIAGLDEAGRGALAGPVVAAVVILPLDNVESLSKLCFVTDSKLMSSNQRNRAFDLIQTYAVAWGIGSISAEIIDEYGIISATKMAMKSALSTIHTCPDYLLIDGRIQLGNIQIKQQSIVRGDQKSLTIAAASVLAKVHRDRMMIQYHSHYPIYGFAKHKGYGTRLHIDAIGENGTCKYHRLSFSPMRNRLNLSYL